MTKNDFILQAMCRRAGAVHQNERVAYETDTQQGDVS